MNDKNIWYHGTIFGFDRFGPLTHFGTRKAAWMSIIRQIVENSVDRDRKLPFNAFPVIAPTLLQIDLDVAKAPSAQNDPGSPGILGMAKALDELTGKSGHVRYWKKYSYLREAGHLGDDKDISLYGRLDLLADDFIAEGIPAFTYPNNVEDKGSTSLVLINASETYPKPTSRPVSRNELLSVLNDTCFWSPNACYGKSFEEIFDNLYPNAA